MHMRSLSKILTILLCLLLNKVSAVTVESSVNECKDLMADSFEIEPSSKKQSTQYTIEVHDGFGGILFKDYNANFQFGYTTYLGGTYAHFFGDLGFRVGLGVTWSSTTYRFENYIDYFYTKDWYDVKMKYDYKLKELKETYTMFQLEIPIQFALKKENWYVNIGPKVVIPLSLEARSSYKELSVWATYPNDYGLDDPIYQAMVIASGNHKTLSKSYDLFDRAKIWIMGSIDFFYTLPTSNSSTLGIGLYADYVFNYQNISGDNQSLIEVSYDVPEDMPPARLIQHSLFSVNPSSSNANHKIEKYGFFSIGIKLIYSFTQKKSIF